MKTQNIQTALHWSWKAVLAGTLLLMGACSGSGGNSGGGTVGNPADNETGGRFIIDPHSNGQSTSMKLVELTWGRLVDVHSFEGGEVSLQPVFRDLVINENIQTDAGRYILDTNPVTLQTRLTILRGEDDPALPDGSSFDTLLNNAVSNLPAILPKGDDGLSPAPFSVINRNACLMLRFDDLLDDTDLAQQRLVDAIRVLVGYAPLQIPFLTRIIFDKNHGGMSGGRFHSTRVLVDMTVTEAEIASLPLGVELNPTGLPISQEGLDAPNVSIRLATVADQQTTFFVLRALGGAPLTREDNGPVDLTVSTLDVVRAMRSGNGSDRNNGFLVDSNRPEVVGSWALSIDRTENVLNAGVPSNREFRVDVTFDTVCQSRLFVGDTIEAGSLLLRVAADSASPLASFVPNVQVELVGSVLDDKDALLGTGNFLSTLDPNLGVPNACWVSFIPRAINAPATGVSTGVRPVFRFTEPMNAESVTAFDTFIMQRGDSSTGAIVSENIVVATVQPSADRMSFFFTPSFPLAHRNGLGELFNIRLQGVTDLAGNTLLNPLPTFDFSLDPSEPDQLNSSFSMRFSDLDEVSAPVEILNASNQNDLRGQFLIDTDAGILRPRQVTFAGNPADRNNPVPSVMIPFIPGVQTPLSPFGSKMQTLWRYADLGFLPFDESRYNLDVVGISWSPVSGTILRDSYPEFEMRLSHSRFMPDEEINAFLLPNFINSGIRRNFSGNILRNDNTASANASQMVVHNRALGYEVRASDLFIASSGTTMLPYPMNRVGNGPLVSYTWRDNANLETGGSQGGGVPLRVEIGQPLNIFPANTQATYRLGQVPAIVLPLLMEFRCFASPEGIGQNAFDISLAINSSIVPNFRAFSTGGVDNNQFSNFVDPANEPTAQGGYNPTSNPPGQPTPFATDNSFYIGQLDTVVKVSRVHTVWIDSRFVAPDYATPVLVPSADQQPLGTEVELDYRGAFGFLDLPLFMDELPYIADSLDPYGNIIPVGSNNPNPDTPDANRQRWLDTIDEIDGLPLIQLRITFISNIETRLAPTLSAIGVPYSGQ